MEYQTTEQVAYLARLLPAGLLLHITLHFWVLPTATKLWDFFAKA